MNITSGHRACLFALALAATATAQVTATMTVTQPVQMQVNGASPVTWNAGPLPATGAILATGGGSALSQLRVQPLALPAVGRARGWTVLADLRASTTSPQPSTASVSGALELTFVATQPTAGILILNPYAWTSSLSTATGGVGIDLNCDGTVDLFASGALPMELPLTVGPAGTSVCIDLSLGTTTPWLGATTLGGATRSWGVVFAELYGIDRAGPGCIGGVTTRRSFNDLAFEIGVFDANATGPGPTMVWGLMVLGTTQASQPLPGSTCTLDVAPLVLLPRDPSSDPWTFRWRLPPAPPLPIGQQVYGQVVWGTTLRTYSTDLFQTF